jgi:hypothetical protein
MKINPHPQVFVEIYVDGRFEIFAPTKVANFRDAIKIVAIKMGVPAMMRQPEAKDMKPGQYEAFLTKFHPMKKSFDIDLVSVK